MYINGRIVKPSRSVEIQIKFAGGTSTPENVDRTQALMRLVGEIASAACSDTPARINEQSA
jgi:hypothetical protein